MSRMRCWIVDENKKPVILFKSLKRKFIHNEEFLDQWANELIREEINQTIN